MHVLIILINAVWMRPSGAAVGIYKHFYSFARVSRRTFYEAARSVTVNLFLHFAKMKSPNVALYAHICLSRCVACANGARIGSAKATF